MISRRRTSILVSFFKNISSLSCGKRKADVAFIALLKDCAKKKDLNRGRRIHHDIILRRTGLLEKTHYIANTLISMYAKCDAIENAIEVFEQIHVRNVVSWNAMIAGYTHQKLCHQALLAFDCMKNEGLFPDAFTFTCVLKACGRLICIDKGNQIHDEIARYGFLDKDVVLGNALVDMYVKFGMISKAEQVLRELPSRDVVSWSSIIAGYAEYGGHDAIRCFESMKNEGISPNVVTFICILKVCGRIGSIAWGEIIHKEISSKGLLEKDTSLGNALVDMYAKCSMLAKAQEVLEELRVRDVVSWSALIAGYAQSDQCHKALECFERMQSEGISPNVVTLLLILKACGNIGAINKGKQIHEEIIRNGLLENDVVLGTALVDMYAKCGELAKAQKLLEELPFRDVVTWSALISGYAQQGHANEALNCFERMENEGLSPDEVTFVSILKACGSSGAIGKGESIHNEIMETGALRRNVVVGSALIDMYTKCGGLAKARQVLDELPLRNVVSWSSLITGYAQEGQALEALNCVEQMQSEGLSPDGVTLLSVLSACGRSGLFGEAQLLFNNIMVNKYGTITHYAHHHTCMVMGFGFAGLFDEAMAVINVLPYLHYPDIWIALLASCRKWGNLKLGLLAFDQIVQLEIGVPQAYALMADIFVSAGMQEDAQNIEAIRLDHASCKR